MMLLMVMSSAAADNDDSDDSDEYDDDEDYDSVDWWQWWRREWWWLWWWGGGGGRGGGGGGREGREEKNADDNADDDHEEEEEDDEDEHEKQEEKKDREDHEDEKSYNADSEDGNKEGEDYEVWVDLWFFDLIESCRWYHFLPYDQIRWHTHRTLYKLPSQILEWMQPDLSNLDFIPWTNRGIPRFTKHAWPGEEEVPNLNWDVNSALRQHVTGNSHWMDVNDHSIGSRWLSSNFLVETSMEKCMNEKNII